MARKRQEIIHQLKAEGVFDIQKELQIPSFAQRLAVISSENAAGYGDFCSQLEHNDYGFKFYPTLFPAIMQGEQVEPTIIASLNQINRQIHRFDVVVIIRGGGATADMSGFDTLALAENVANFPLPVITGIGHDRDESVLDMISNTRVKTPTAAAALLIDNLANVWKHIENLQNSITTQVTQHMIQEQSRLDRCSERIPLLFSMVKTRQEARLERLSSQITNNTKSHLSAQQQRLLLITTGIRPLIERGMLNERHRLDQLSIRLNAVDPKLLLKRGYSITTLQGKTVRDPSQLQPGDEIETRLEHGTIHSIVK